MKVQHRFVEFIPESLEDGVLYIALDYGTVLHKCCCGCGNEVNTPLSPNDWKLIYNGESITLRPSIGNWSFDCRSHYWITNNEIEWAATWNYAQIEEVRETESLERKAYYEDKLPNNPKDKPVEKMQTKKPKRWFDWFLFWK